MLQITPNLSYFKNIHPHLSESRFLSARFASAKTRREAKGSYLDELYENDEIDEYGKIEEVDEPDDYSNEEEQEEFEYDEEES